MFKLQWSSVKTRLDFFRSAKSKQKVIIWKSLSHFNKSPERLTKQPGVGQSQDEKFLPRIKMIKITQIHLRCALREIYCINILLTQINKFTILLTILLQIIII